MAIFKFAVAFLFVLLVLDNVYSDQKVIREEVADPPADPPATVDCGAACGVRCSLSSRPNLCHRACGTCCDRCHCVPPGTSGHYEDCPCYANLTTHGGRHKCP